MPLIRPSAIALMILAVAGSSYAQTGLTHTPEEVRLWRERAAAGDVYGVCTDPSLNPPEWERVLADANAAVENSANDRYDHFYRGAGCVPFDGGNAALTSPLEPRPPRGSARSILNAALAFLVTEQDRYVQPVVTELRWYASQPELDFRATDIEELRPAGSSLPRRWCEDMNDLNPGFFIAEWVTRMLHAYSLTMHSDAYSDDDHRQIMQWLYAASRYWSKVAELDIDAAIRGGRNVRCGTPVDYTLINSSRNDTSGSGWDGGPNTSHLMHMYNNRRTAEIVTGMAAGVFFEAARAGRFGDRVQRLAPTRAAGEALLCEGVRTFHEMIAYGTWPNGIQADAYRRADRVGNPEQGYGYTQIGVGHLVTMADLYARHVGVDLYEYVLDEGEVARFFPDASRPWYADLAIPGRGLRRTLEAYWLGMLDQGPEGRWTSYGELLDGRTGQAGGRNYVFDVWHANANLYYQDEDFLRVYTRRDADRHAYVPYPASPSGAGAFGSYTRAAPPEASRCGRAGAATRYSEAFTGPLGEYPSKLFMYGQMEGRVWPFVEGDGGIQPSIDLRVQPLDELVFPQNEVELVASGPDEASFRWDVVSAPNLAAIHHPNAAVTPITVGGPGIYELRVTAQVADQSASRDVRLRVYDLANPRDLAGHSELDASHPAAHLFDGCTDSEERCMTGTGDTASFHVDFSYPTRQEIRRARVFGDAEGTWVSERVRLVADGVEVATAAALTNDWVDLDVGRGVTAERVRLEVIGGTAAQARELELFGLPEGTGFSPPEVEVNDGDAEILVFDPDVGTASGDGIRVVLVEELNDAEEITARRLLLSPPYRVNLRELSAARISAFSLEEAGGGGLQVRVVAGGDVLPTLDGGVADAGPSVRDGGTGDAAPMQSGDAGLADASMDPTDLEGGCSAVAGVGRGTHSAEYLFVATLLALVQRRRRASKMRSATTAGRRSSTQNG